MLKAYDERTGEEVKPGDIVTSFRGEEFIFKRATRERTEGKSGKVVAKSTDGLCSEYYDKVFGLIVRNVYIGMEWVALKSTQWEAKGKDGVFVIERRGGKFWSYYSSADTHIKLRPKDKLEEAKEMCENSEYWETAK